MWEPVSSIGKEYISETNTCYYEMQWCEKGIWRKIEIKKERESYKKMQE